jgi:hypothetical protein
MNYIEESNRAARFIGLQVPNQVPARGTPAQFDYLYLGFLYAVFAQVTHAQLERHFQRFEWVRFSDCDESYLFRKTVAASGGCLNTGANVRESVAQPLYLIWFRRHPR